MHQNTKLFSVSGNQTGISVNGSKVTTSWDITKTNKNIIYFFIPTGRERQENKGGRLPLGPIVTRQ